MKAWITQLLKYAPLVANHEGQVEIRLFAHKGKVKAHPTIILNGGPQEMIDPE